MAFLQNFLGNLASTGSLGILFPLLLCQHLTPPVGPESRRKEENQRLLSNVGGSHGWRVWVPRLACLFRCRACDRQRGWRMAPLGSVLPQSLFFLSIYHGVYQDDGLPSGKWVWRGGMV